MRRAVTLIELIFTMLIVALVFTVVPKIVFVTNKSFETTVKEEALYNALALMGLLTHLPWDEKNVNGDAILTTEAGAAAFTCDPDAGYRRGGFYGGRNCFAEELSASPVGREGDEYNDIDDYDGWTVEAGTSGGAKYLMRVGVRYLGDPPSGSDIDLSALSPSQRSTDIKEINVTVTYAPSRAKSPFRATLYYHAANIGAMHLYKRPWR
ncbi:type II secretion system protein [Hydrogenimonas sp. SS33]|uniref:type II secretion system protein n=1 Tax=Hydrogenimonas leucolamina TaxID=2954236 RepID=UPI00336BC42D